MAHGVLNVDDNVSVTENFLAPTALDLLAVYAAFGWEPLPFKSDSQFLLRNLVNRDLGPELRRFARLMFAQARTVEPPEEEVDFSY